MGDASAQEHVEKVHYELSCERNAKEVLAFALARMLREARCPPPDQEQHCVARGSAQGVDELQDQLHLMSVQDSPPAGMRATIVQSSVTAARRILEMPAAELSTRAPCQVFMAALRSALASAGRASTVACNHVEPARMQTHASNGAPFNVWRDRDFWVAGFVSFSPERQPRPSRTYRGWFDSACLDSRVLRFAPSDMSSLAHTPPCSTARNTAQHAPLSQPPDTSSLFPGASCNTQRLVTAQCLQVAEPYPTASRAELPHPPSLGMLPEASFNFGVASSYVTPHGGHQMPVEASVEGSGAGHGTEDTKANEGVLPSERDEEGAIHESSPSPSNPMCTPSSAGTSYHAREPCEKVLEIPAGCSSGGSCERHTPACPDMSPLAGWKTGRIAGGAELSVEQAATPADASALEAPVSSQAWLGDVIQPTGEPCSFVVGRNSATSTSQGDAALPDASAAAASHQMYAVCPEPVKRNREGLRSCHPASLSTEAPLHAAAAGYATEPNALAPQCPGGPEWLANDGPRPMFSSNSPELVDRYKDSEAAPAAGLRLPDVNAKPGESGDDDATATVGRTPVMNGLQASEGGPFSVFRHSDVGEMRREPRCDSQLPMEPEGLAAATHVTPPGPSGPSAGPGPLQWLAGLEGQVAPKSFHSHVGASANCCSHSAASPPPQQTICKRNSTSPPDAGAAQTKSQRADDNSGSCNNLADRLRHEPGAGTSDAQISAAETCKPATVNRYDDWLSEQLAAAQRYDHDGDSSWRSHRGKVNPLAVVQMQPSCRGVARRQDSFDAGSDGKFAKRIEDADSSVSESGSAGTSGAQGSRDPSPAGSSMHEPFAWRGKLPGATARAAALEIRHFCALSQQADGSRALSAALIHTKGKGSVQPPDRRKPPERRKKLKSRLIVPHSPDLATARRVHGDMGNGEGLTESKEHVRRVTDAGRKRATVLAGHFRGSYAQRAAVWGRLRKAGGEVGYATLAKQRRKAAGHVAS